MQVRFSLDAALRRSEFVNRALHFPTQLTMDVEPHQLTLQARETLAQCNPDLPEVFDLLPCDIDAGADAETGHLWEITFNPNAYTVAEVVEIWAKEFLAARDKSA